MAEYDGLTPGQILADASVAEFIKQLGLGIAEAQAALDRNAIEQITILSQTTPSFSGKSLIELGLTPPFYHYQYADLEVSLSLSLKVQKEIGVDLGFNIGSSDQQTESSGSSNSGQLGIEVKTRSSEPAKGVIELVAATAGTVTTGNTTVGLVAGGATGTQVAIVPKSIRSTAFALAEMLIGDDVPEIDRVIVDLAPLGTVIPTASPPSSPAGPYVCSPNRVVIKGTREKPPWALVEVLQITGDGMTLGGGDSIAGGFSGADLAAAAVSLATAIDAVTDYTAAPIIKKGRFDDPNFDGNSAVIRPAEATLLRRVARVLMEDSSWTVRLDGYINPPGGQDFGMKLSQDRADAVQRFLVEQGVLPAQITTKACGTTPTLVPDGEDNRRVEIHVTSGPANAVELTYEGSGFTTWNDPGTTDLVSTPPAAIGQPKVRDQVNAVTSVDTSVAIDNGIQTHTLFLNPTIVHSATTQHDYTVAGSPPSEEAVAAGLAAAVTEHVTDVEAWAEGNVVHLLPPGSLARLTMYTTERGSTTGLLPLTTTGSLSKVSGFAGGLDAAEPADGDTVSIGGTQLQLRAAGANFINHEFNKGVDANATASNLATAISGLTGFSAAAAGAVVTVTGPAGTAVATSNPNAFVWSAAKIPGLAEFKSEERNRAMAWGGSLGVRFSRQFGMEVTGNSAIRARLVAVPAPTELLDEIRDYLGALPQQGAGGTTP